MKLKYLLYQWFFVKSGLVFFLQRIASPHIFKKYVILSKILSLILLKLTNEIFFMKKELNAFIMIHNIPLYIQKNIRFGIFYTTKILSKK